MPFRVVRQLQRQWPFRCEKWDAALQIRFSVVLWQDMGFVQAAARARALQGCQAIRVLIKPGALMMFAALYDLMMPGGCFTDWEEALLGSAATSVGQHFMGRAAPGRVALGFCSGIQCGRFRFAVQVSWGGTLLRPLAALPRFCGGLRPRDGRGV
jgi:hypothetical protein